MLQRIDCNQSQSYGNAQYRTTWMIFQQNILRHILKHTMPLYSLHRFPLKSSTNHQKEWSHLFKILPWICFFVFFTISRSIQDYSINKMQNIVQNFSCKTSVTLNHCGPGLNWWNICMAYYGVYTMAYYITQDKCRKWKDSQELGKLQEYSKENFICIIKEDIMKEIDVNLTHSVIMKDKIWAWSKQQMSFVLILQESPPRDCSSISRWVTVCFKM